MHKTMAPEQRTKHRNFASFSIQLRGENGESNHCKALNLSVAGMLLEYNGASLAIGSSVDIFVSLNEWQSEIPAIVIHSNSSCTGIMFREPQPDLYRTVTGSMRCARLSINSRTPISSDANNPYLRAHAT